jgi:hypothetical protein
MKIFIHCDGGARLVYERIEFYAAKRIALEEEVLIG